MIKDARAGIFQLIAHFALAIAGVEHGGCSAGKRGGVQVAANSHEFGRKMATKSPGLIPAATSPRASLVTSSPYCA